MCDESQQLCVRWVMSGEREVPFFKKAWECLEPVQMVMGGIQ